jgi:hypothetical protein
MRSDRRDEALTDSALDREIERALAVEPSPDFVARVRTSIASEPPRPAWHLSWAFAGAGAAVAAIVFALVVAWPERTVAPAPMIVQVAPPAPVAPQPSAVPDASTVRSPEAVALQRPKKAVARQQGASRSTKAFAFQTSEPEILIDSREAAALQRLITGVRDGRVDLSPVLHATTPTAMELPPITDLIIAPLSIEPLAPVEGAEGVRQ